MDANRIRWKCIRLLEVTKRKLYCKDEKDNGLDDTDCDIKNSLPAHLGAFILSKSKRIMNNFIREIKGFYNNSIYDGDTDSLYINRKYWHLLGKAILVGKNTCHGKMIT